MPSLRAVDELYIKTNASRSFIFIHVTVIPHSSVCLWAGLLQIRLVEGIYPEGAIFSCNRQLVRCRLPILICRSPRQLKHTFRETKPRRYVSHLKVLGVRGVSLTRDSMEYPQLLSRPAPPSTGSAVLSRGLWRGHTSLRLAISESPQP